MDDVAEDIKTTVLDLVSDFKDNIFNTPSEQGDLLLVEFFFKKMDAKSVADHIVKHVLPHKKKIEDRKVTFFKKKRKEIFSGLPADRVEYFADLVGKPEAEGGMSDENKDVVWSYFDTFVALGERYKKDK
jgi:hypothetical protein